MGDARDARYGYRTYKEVDAATVPDPPAGVFSMFYDSVDGVLKVKSFGGTSPVVEVPVPDPVGEVDGRMLEVVTGALVYRDAPVVGAMPQGTTFPATPTTGERYQRTDLDYLIFYYDGTRWLSEQMFAIEYDGISVAADDTFAAVMPVHDIYVHDLEVSSYVLPTLDGTNYWTVSAEYALGAGAAQALGSVNDSAGTASEWEKYPAVIDAVVAASAADVLLLSVVGTGSPGAFLGAARLTYRRVAT